MSNSGKNYTKEKISQRYILDKKKNHPIRLFIKSWDFWGKLCLSLFVFGIFIYSLSDNLMTYFLWIIYACICLPLFPFAKKCSDDVLRHYFSDNTFENIINNGGASGFGTLYLMIIIPFVIPLSIGYFLYQTINYK